MSKKIIKTDVLIIGAGAAGLMCAIEAGKRGRKVMLLDHANKAGKKILISGGSRCNFTNMDITADNFISHNPHFCKSALSRFTQWDFLNLVNDHQIAYQERDHGELFCRNSAKDILNMLLDECKKANAELRLNCDIINSKKLQDGSYQVETSQGLFHTTSLVIASGGLSFPKMGASPFGYKIAEQFGHTIWPTSAGLVPFTLQPADKEKYSPLSGISIDSIVSNERNQFRENILFTHRGLSGPAILQISSYWKPGEAVTINLLPETDIETLLKTRQTHQAKILLKTCLAELLPKRLLPSLFDPATLDKPLQELAQTDITNICQQLTQWPIKPNATEGYRTAEVTLGGVDCNQLSSKTMQSSLSTGLYFIGEVVDVTGWLGGYNFQWAWSSGWCAGQVV